VSWSVEENQSGRVLHWTWNEHDGPPVALPTREGFGKQLLQGVLTYQIKAKVEIAFDPDGLRVSIDVPLLVED
jgi:two-component sensor histidine kinase